MTISVGNGLMYLTWRKLHLKASASKSCMPSRIAPFVEPHPTIVMSACSGPKKFTFFLSGMSPAAKSSLCMRFCIIFTLFSEFSVIWPNSSCSSPVVWKMPPLVPGMVRGETPEAVNRYLLNTPLPAMSASDAICPRSICKSRVSGILAVR